jgi:hypothetical protein
METLIPVWLKLQCSFFSPPDAQQIHRIKTKFKNTKHFAVEFDVDFPVSVS